MTARTEREDAPSTTDGRSEAYDNPRYEGATPEVVARALLRHRPPDKPKDDKGQDDPEAA